MNGFGLAVSARYQHHMPGVHNGAQTLGDAVRGHLVDIAAEEAGVVDAGLRGEGLDPGAGGQ
ncbi:hypothetical protein SDC9_207653 [bioreactor metagenome]|uniref:Uncharacterized protein n=1 Tax=bioreactor metagenome TaxID=1076179 RepID=A0A645J9V4_9ZZZZ